MTMASVTRELPIDSVTSQSGQPPSRPLPPGGASGGSVCVIGAGTAGLSALRELRLRGIPVVCYEQGSQVGGNWRYENDNGVSAAYASLRCNVSRRRMQYRSFPIPASYGDFVSHTDMAAYIDAYVCAFRLDESIRFASKVLRVERPGAGNGWNVELADGSVHHHDSVIVANGHDWQPAWPLMPGRESATIPITHAHDYRTPEPHVGKRTLVIGTGQSACEIATELSRKAGHVAISARRGAHIMPRRMYRMTFDEFDIPRLNRLPWKLMNSLVGWGVRLNRTVTDGLPRPPWRILEQVPIVSSELGGAIRERRITVLPSVAGVDGAQVRFTGGYVSSFDHVICATGYRLSFPFLDPSLLTHKSKAVTLYRRIVAPGLPGIFLIGFVDAPSGNLPIFEGQAAWIGDVLEGSIRLPDPEEMRTIASRREPRTLERFPLEEDNSIRTDAHAYLRNLTGDRPQARPLGAR
jgi:flavin-binding monooxygenase-like protein